MSGEEFLLDQLRARVDYWNRLVEIERDFQAEKEQLLSAASAEMEQLATYIALTDGKLTEALSAGARARSQARTRRTPEPLAAEIAELRDRLRELRKQYREVRRTTFGNEKVKAALRTLGSERTAVIRKARREHVLKGLWWGNYLDVELAYKTARQKAGSRLRFQRTGPEGRVSVWFQHGLPTSDVWGKDSRLTIARVPEEAWTSDVRSVRRRLARTRVWLRAGSNPDRSPRLIEAEMVMHRPLPHGLIRHASIIRERIASHYRHRLVITVAVQDIPTRDGREVGIDIGWRLFEDRLRVAVAVDEENQLEELSLPQEMLGGFAQVRDLQAVRDTHFNGAKAMLAAFLHTAQMPDWLRDATSTLTQWRSQGRLTALALQWRDRRFKDDAVYAMLEAWRKRDKHLWEWQANLRDKLLARRREMYRLWAISIARRYGTVVIEEFDLRRIVSEDNIDVADRMRFIAALSQLRSILEHTCAREGVRIVKVPASYTTQDCAFCANREQFDARKEVRHRCSKCGAEWDQDENAARNLLKRAKGSQVSRKEV